MAIFFIHHVVASGLHIRFSEHSRRIIERLLFQRGWDLINGFVEGGIFFRSPGNNQRRARLINQYRIDFVDDGEGQLTLQTIFCGKGHVRAQVVETEFVIGAINNVCLIGIPFLFGNLTRLNYPNSKAERFVNR